jgi:hypothetical protein
LNNTGLQASMRHILLRVTQLSGHCFRQFLARWVNSGPIRGHTTHHHMPSNTVAARVAYLWRVATKDKPGLLGIHWDPSRRRCRAMTSSTLPNMETPTTFDHSIRFSVPPHQRSTFGLAIAGLPPAFLGFPTTGEAFESTAACKTRLQGFSLWQVE